MRHRTFIKVAVVLLLLGAIARGTIPIPIGFWKPSSGPRSSDADVNDWISRVQAQGSDVTIAGTVDAVTAFVVGLKADAIWDKIGRLNIYAGDGLNALKAPLKITCGAATDTLNNFVSGDYSQSVGLTGDGSSKYISTGFIPNSCGSMGDDNIHLAVYLRTASDDAGSCMGSADGLGGQNQLAPSFAGTTYLDCNNATTGRLTVLDSSGSGLYIGTRVLPAVGAIIWKNGTNIASNVSAGTTRSTSNMVVHAFNNAGTVLVYTTRTLELYSAGNGLTATDVANYGSRYATLRTALGR